MKEKVMKKKKKKKKKKKTMMMMRNMTGVMTRRSLPHSLCWLQ